MNRGTLCALALVANLSLSGRTVQAQTEPLSSADTARLIKRAHQVFDSLEAGRFAPVFALFSEQMVAAVPTTEKLAELWAGIIAQTGALKSLEQGEVTQGFRAVAFRATFENGTFTAVVVYGPGDTIAGLAVRPAGA